MSPFKHQRQAFLDRNLSRFSLESAIGILKSFARVLYRLPRVFLMSIVRAYRFALSPDHSFWAKALDRPPYCRHFPSCSSYGLESLEKHGAIMGSFYAIRRILSCNPWSKWGYDPVPAPSHMPARVAPASVNVTATRVPIHRSHPSASRKERISSHHSDSHV